MLYFIPIRGDDELADFGRGRRKRNAQDMSLTCSSDPNMFAKATKVTTAYSVFLRNSSFARVIYVIMHLC
jgi:hypothetical protein